MLIRFGLETLSPNEAAGGPVFTTGGSFDGARRWWSQGSKKLLVVPDSNTSNEMKRNAQAISEERDSGATIPYEACKQSPFAKGPSRVRPHLMEYSEDAVVHSCIVERLQWDFESVNFMAPTVTCGLFGKTVLKALARGRARSYNHFQLSYCMEQSDRTCEPIIG